ncbi:MAG: aminoacyl-tRNA hydrolase [Pseudomonadales bacterium]|nr:aminoacyl-tRNA hydrolase [Pseudomonadales bacterium]MCP5183614.1 aminoacyl-tRNA hydrolase [Pseudomonadales bacterium]
MNASEIPSDALTFQFVRSRGPGGQNVNKVATAVQLDVAVDRLGETPVVQRRLLRLAGSRATADGRIVLFADGARTQSRNRELALARLAELIERARHEPRRRVATKPTKTSVQRRLTGKRRDAVVKKLRGSPTRGDD